MDQASTADLIAFLSEAGLRAFSEVDLLRGFCDRLRKAGVPVARALVLIDTLHPVHEGHVFRWRREGEPFQPVTEYGRVERRRRRRGEMGGQPLSSSAREWRGGVEASSRAG